MGLLAKQPVQDSLPFTRILFVATFVIVALQLLILVRRVFRLRYWMRHVGSRPDGLRQVLFRIIIPVALNLLVAYIFLIGLPQFAGLSFTALLVYIPDWGLGFVLGGLLAGSWLVWGLAAIFVVCELRTEHSSTERILESSSQRAG